MKYFEVRDVPPEVFRLFEILGKLGFSPLDVFPDTTTVSFVGLRATELFFARIVLSGAEWYNRDVDFSVDADKIAKALKIFADFKIEPTVEIADGKLLIHSRKIRYEAEVYSAWAIEKTQQKLKEAEQLDYPSFFEVSVRELQDAVARARKEDARWVVIHDKIYFIASKAEEYRLISSLDIKARNLRTPAVLDFDVFRDMINATSRRLTPTLYYGNGEYIKYHVVVGNNELSLFVKEYPYEEERMEILSSLGIEVKPPAKPLAPKEKGIPEDRFRSYLDTVKTTLTITSLRNKVAEFPWDEMSEEQKKTLREAIERRIKEIKLEKMYRKTFETALSLIKSCETEEDLKKAEEEVEKLPLPETMKDTLRREIERKRQEVRGAVPAPPTPPSISPEIEKELYYLQVQKSLGMKMHSQIEKSLKRLEELGCPKEKIEEIRKWFE